MRNIVSASSLLVLVACGGTGDPSAAAGSAASDSIANPAPTPIDLSTHGLPLMLLPPDPLTTGGAAPTIVWKDGPGVLEIKAGDHFGLTIAEEPGDPARLKAGLDRDLLQKHVVLTDTADMVVYRSAFPDDPDLVFIHFYQVIRVGDRQFVVEDADGTRYNEADIRVMQRCLVLKPPA